MSALAVSKSAGFSAEGRRIFYAQRRHSSSLHRFLSSGLRAIFQAVDERL
jgi:hypothetical protein